MGVLTAVPRPYILKNLWPDPTPGALHWVPGKVAGAFTLKKLECSKQAFDGLNSRAWNNGKGLLRQNFLD
jgi:hypothetical protein